jgi:hypothetical protein
VRPTALLFIQTNKHLSYAPCVAESARARGVYDISTLVSAF